MNILKKEQIVFLERSRSKKKLLKFISQKAFELGVAKNAKDVFKAFLQREKQDSTGMEDFIAIPHAASNSILKVALIIVCLKKPVSWKTLDKRNQVKFAIALLVPKKDRNKDHLKFLSKTSQKLLDAEVRKTLNSQDKDKIYGIFK